MNELTVHQRFIQLQANLFTEDGYRVVSRKVAERFCERHDARISPRQYGTENLPDEVLILYFDHLEIGEGSQLIAFVGELKEQRIHAES